MPFDWPWSATRATALTRLGQRQPVEVRGGRMRWRCRSPDLRSRRLTSTSADDYAKTQDLGDPPAFAAESSGRWPSRESNSSITMKAPTVTPGLLSCVDRPIAYSRVEAGGNVLQRSVVMAGQIDITELCPALRRCFVRTRPVADARDLRRRRARQHQPLQSVARPAAEPAHRAHHRRRGAARRAVLPGAADGRRRHGPLAGLAAALHRERLPPAHRGRRPARHHARPTGRSPTPSSSPTMASSNGRSASPGRPAPTPSNRRAAVATRARRCRCRATRRSSTRAAASSAGTRSRPRRRPCRARTTGARRR